MSSLSLVLRPAVASAERGRVPDPLIRWGIRRLCEAMKSASIAPARLDELVASMRASELALVPERANAQHYEVPPEFFRLVLGPHLKYSCCHWSPGVKSLAVAEAEALEFTGRRAGLRDGQDVLELGCGWGSLTMWMAERFPASRITAVTNSSTQAPYVRAMLAAHGLRNVTVVQADMNDFDTAERFDRVVSVEMFEHMRNYELLLRRIAGWLAPGGELFVHVFRHKERPFLYGDGADDWMGRHFFSGGIMPSRDLLSRFDRDLRVTRTWDWDGEHYRKTSEAWLERLDEARDEVIPLLAGTDSRRDGEIRFHRWRLFFLSCAELFGYADGDEWGVSHYRLEPARASD